MREVKSLVKTLVVVPSIHKIDNLLKYYENFSRFGHDTEFVIIDEFPSFQSVRKYNNEIFNQVGVEYSFYGQKERKEWLEERSIEISVIPERCHAETSFGFLIAWEHRDEYDLIIELDDDTYPLSEEGLGWHFLSSLLHTGLKCWVEDLNRLYRSVPALHELEFDPAGFEWIVCNFTPLPRFNYRVGAPRGAHGLEETFP